MAGNEQGNWQRAAGARDRRNPIFGSSPTTRCADSKLSRLGIDLQTCFHFARTYDGLPATTRKRVAWTRPKFQRFAPRMLWCSVTCLSLNRVTPNAFRGGIRGSDRQPTDTTL